MERNDGNEYGALVKGYRTVVTGVVTSDIAPVMALAYTLGDRSPSRNTWEAATGLATPPLLVQYWPLAMRRSSLMRVIAKRPSSCSRAIWFCALLLLFVDANTVMMPAATSKPSTMATMSSIRVRPRWPSGEWRAITSTFTVGTPRQMSVWRQCDGPRHRRPAHSSEPASCRCHHTEDASRLARDRPGSTAPCCRWAVRSRASNHPE